MPIVISIIAAAFLMVSCGDVKVKTQPQDKLVLEKPSPENSYSLSKVDIGQTKSFGMGSMPIFQKDVEAKNIATLIELTEARDEALLDRISYQWSEVVRPFGEEFYAKSNKLKDLNSKKSLMAAERTVVLRDQWFEKKLAEVDASIDKARSMRAFNHYCEAKVWERAVNITMLGARFKKRPTPAYLCEGHYKALGLFEYGDHKDACSDKAAGDDYFSCLWTHGVLKTTLFAKWRYGSETEQGKQLVGLDPTLLKQNLAFQRRLSNSILQHKPFKIYPEQGNRTVVVKIGNGTKEIMPTFEADSVYSIIFNIENARDRFLIVNSVGESVAQKVTDDLTLLLKFVSGPSVNEYLFNQPSGVELSEEQAAVRQGDLDQAKIELRDLLDIKIPEIDDQIEVTNTSLNELGGTVIATIERLKGEKCGIHSTDLRCTEQSTHGELLQFVRQTSVTSILVTNASLRIVKQTQERIELTLKLDPDAANSFVGCIGDGDCGNNLDGELMVSAKVQEDGYLDLILALPTELPKLLALWPSVSWSKEHADKIGQFNFTNVDSSVLLGGRLRLRLKVEEQKDATDPQKTILELLRGSVELSSEVLDAPMPGSIIFRQTDNEIVAEYDKLIDAIF